MFCVDVKGSIKAIKQAVEKGKISEEQLNEKCKKTLAIKELLLGDGVEMREWDEEKAFSQSLPIQVEVAQKAVTWLKKPSRPFSWGETRCFVLDMKKQNQDNLAHHQLSFVGGRSYQRGEGFRAKIKESKGLEVRDFGQNEEGVGDEKESRIICVAG